MSHRYIMATAASTILTNRTLTAMAPSFRGIARILVLSKTVLVMSYVVGISAIIFNSIQLWLLAKTFQRNANSLLIVIKHLCPSDLLNGVSLLLPPSLALIETEFPGNIIIQIIWKLYTRVGRIYVITVSTFLLCLLTVTKMLKIVHNRSCTR